MGVLSVTKKKLDFIVLECQELNFYIELGKD